MSKDRKLHSHGHGHEHGHRHQHGEGGFSIDVYAYASGLRRVNPVFKVLFAVFVLILTIGLDDPFVSLFVILTMAVLSIWKGKVDVRGYCSLMTIPIAFMIFGSVAIAAGFSRQPLGDYNLSLHFFYLYATKSSILKALFLILKAFGAVSAMFMLTLSTPASEIISALQRLHVPQMIVELMNMIYRYIFIMMDTQRKMKNSAQSRLGYCDFKTSCLSFGGIASNLFIVSLKKANAYYDAMESRCYDGELRFLEEEKKVETIEVLSAAIYLVVLVGIHIGVKCF
ncbi:MAG: cobalt ECF transporter T component CbiQ [Lachnospiraceae bacterium]|nr:cobalt ECF transporter T component CbiQ [Lachnospiraceae bacterium]